jgi:hypothetical protein
VSDLRDDAGHTLVEVLVTAALTVTVLLVTLLAFDQFNAAAQDNSRLTDTQDGLRRQVDDLTRLLRTATPVPGTSDAVLRPTAAGRTNDIVFGSYTWPGRGPSEVPHVLRLCVGGDRALWLQGRQDPAVGPLDPGTACPSAAAGWTRTRLLGGRVANTADRPAFDVDAERRTVGIDLRVDRGDRAGTLALRTAAHVRSAGGRPPNVSQDDLDVTCTTQDGRRTALLSLDAAVGAAQGLETSYTVGGLVVGQGAVRVAADTAVQVGVTVTNALGLKQLLIKEVRCP